MYDLGEGQRKANERHAETMLSLLSMKEQAHSYAASCVHLQEAQGNAQ